MPVFANVFRATGLVNHNLQVGDVLEVLRREPTDSFDGCLTDPPYGLSFMSKEWDRGVPPAEVWREVLRVLKPGAVMLAFGGTRTYHRLACAIEDAGFEIRDCMMWLYGQGFPKGHGCLKPAWEPILVASKRGMAPGLNIDGCRIAHNEECKPMKAQSGGNKVYAQSGRYEATTELKANGRWPANLVLDETAAAALDQMSGNLHGAGFAQDKQEKWSYDLANGNTYGNGVISAAGEGGSGGASRFFYCAKASRRERGEDNAHPTVKPVALTEYLARLILPPAARTRRLLVPFAGSGSEMIGAKRAGWEYALGIDNNADYVAIAERRLNGTGTPDPVIPGLFDGVEPEGSNGWLGN